jgi:hypothetical protein
MGGAPAASPAIDLAAAPRNVSLASLVVSPVPELGLAKDGPKFGSSPDTAGRLRRARRAQIVRGAIYGVAGLLVVAGMFVAVRRRRPRRA